MPVAPPVDLHPAVRHARPADVPQIHQLICDLASYEHAADQVRATEHQLSAALFGPEPAVFALVAESEKGNPGQADFESSQPTGVEIAGFALWFVSFSTWEGVHGIYLEDLYVAPKRRGTGLGKALLQSLAAIAVSRGYARFEWAVLNWNQPSIDFYIALGGRPQDEWTVFRLAGDALRAAGAEVRTPGSRQDRSAGGGSAAGTD